MRLAILVSTLALIAPAAYGQTVFRSVMPDGKIVYGDKPAPGAKEAKEVTLTKPNIIAPVSIKPPPSAKPKDAVADTPADPVKAAQQRLDAAKAALDAGREERDGDRIGTANKGITQRTDTYYQRVKALEDAVAAAQKQFDDVRR